MNTPASKERKMLLEIGFWCFRTCAGMLAPGAHCDCNSASGVPQTFVDSDWTESSAEFQHVMDYAQSGMLESYEHGYSWCRFNDCPLAGGARDMGCATLTDGTWVWPEGLAHYLFSHDVKPPQAFIDHVLLQVQFKPGRPVGVYGVWNPETRSAEPIPQATRDWLTSHSTLKLIDPPPASS